MSFTDSDLSQVVFDNQSGTLSLEEVRAQVAETVRNAQARGMKAPLPLPPQLLLMRTSHAGLDIAGFGPGLCDTGRQQFEFALFFHRSADGSGKRHACPSYKRSAGGRGSSQYGDRSHGGGSTWAGSWTTS